MNDLKFWVENGRKDNQNYMAIIYDLEDKDYFPMYFQFYSDLEKYRLSIVSIMRLEYKEYYKLYSKISGVDF